MTNGLLPTKNNRIIVTPSALYWTLTYLFKKGNYPMATSIPTTDSERIVSLRTALESNLRDQTAGHPYLAAATVAELEALCAPLEAAVHNMAQATARHRAALAASADAITALQAQVRHIWTTVRWRVRWQGTPPAVLAYYHLPTHRTPYPKRRDGWLELAERLLQGDAAAIQAGYPSAADTPALSAARDALASALDALNAAKQTQQTAQEALISLRRRSDGAIRHLNGDLRYALRDRSATAQQQIMRTYGVRFRRIAAAPTTAARGLASPPVLGWHLQPAAVAGEPVPVGSGQ